MEKSRKLDIIGNFIIITSFSQAPIMTLLFQLKFQCWGAQAPEVVCGVRRHGSCRCRCCGEDFCSLCSVHLKFCMAGVNLLIGYSSFMVRCLQVPWSFHSGSTANIWNNPAGQLCYSSCPAWLQPNTSDELSTKQISVFIYVGLGGKKPSPVLEQTSNFSSMSPWGWQAWGGGRAVMQELSQQVLPALFGGGKPCLAPWHSKAQWDHT